MEGAVTIITGATSIIGLIPEVLAMFVEPPTVYFTAMALTSGVFGLTRRLVPLKKR